MFGRVGKVVAVALASSLVAVGCTQDETDGSAPRKDLRIGFTAAPISLDFTQDDGAAIPEALLVNVYEGLVKIDEYGTLVPLLAKDWEVSKDRTVYTFELRENATFSNGEKFTAEDAVFSIERVQQEWKPAVKAGMDVVQDAKALNPTTLQVKLEQPSNNWLFQMATRIGAMFPEGDVDKLATEAVGTGPYQVAEWNEGESLSLQRRDDYWGDKPDVEDITLQYFDDPNALNNALRAGDIDVISNVQAPESLAVFSNELKYRISEGSTNGEVLLAFNHDNEALSDLKVRQAIKYGLDRREIRETAWDGRGQLIGSMVPPTDPWYEDLSNRYPHDPARARDLLRQAGFEPNELSLRLRIPTLPYAERGAQVVKSQLKDIGIKVELDTLEFPDRWLAEVFGQADYDLSIISHVEPWDMPVLFGDPDYYLKYDNPEFRDLLAQADGGTRQQQIEKLKEAAAILSDDAASDFLFLMPSLKVSSRRVEGVPTNTVSEAFDLTTLSLSASGKS